jgi:hypothetical protein
MCKSSIKEGRVLAQSPCASELSGSDETDERLPVITSIHLHRISMYAALYSSLFKVESTSSEISILNLPWSWSPKPLFCRKMKPEGHSAFVEATNSLLVQTTVGFNQRLAVGESVGVDKGVRVVGLVVVGTLEVGLLVLLALADALLALADLDALLALADALLALACKTCAIRKEKKSAKVRGLPGFGSENMTFEELLLLWKRAKTTAMPISFTRFLQIILNHLNLRLV